MSEHRILKELLSAFSEGAPGRVAVTATAAGTSLDENKLIQFVEPIWVSDSNIIVLPSPMPGKAVILAGAATGGELRSHDPATVNINSADNFPGIAVAVDEMMIAFCESETSWKAFGIGSDGPIRGGGAGSVGYTKANGTQSSLLMDEGDELSIDVVLETTPEGTLEYDVYLDNTLVQASVTLPYVVSEASDADSGVWEVRVRDVTADKEYRTRSVSVVVSGWILAGGDWSDTSVWDDLAVWIDA